MSENLQLEDRAAIKALMVIPNVGPAIARDLILLEIRETSDLRGQDPCQLYEQLCTLTGSKQDPCVLDTMKAVVHFANTGEKRTWWSFTPERKKPCGSG